jgi:hypothetical protein
MRTGGAEVRGVNSPMTENESFYLMETMIRSYRQEISISSKISDSGMKISEDLRQTVTRQAHDYYDRLKDMGTDYKQIKQSGRPARRKGG